MKEIIWKKVYILNDTWRIYEEIVEEIIINSWWITYKFKDHNRKIVYDFNWAKNKCVDMLQKQLNEKEKEIDDFKEKIEKIKNVESYFDYYNLLWF